MASKLKLLLLVVLLFGAPALVVFSLVEAEIGSIPHGAIDAAQPGGRIEGALVDPDGAPIADENVRLVLVRDPQGPVEAATARTGRDGRFAFDAPALVGHYDLVAGGGTWQRLRQPHSFVDRAGRAIEPAPVEMRLERGCELALTFARRDGHPADDGAYDLDGELGRGFFFGLVRPALRQSGSIAAGELAIGGLPPMRARLVARMAGGERIELALELVPGLNQKRIEY